MSSSQSNLRMICTSWARMFPILSSMIIVWSTFVIITKENVFSLATSGTPNEFRSKNVLVDDTQCSMEVVDEANSRQLELILESLSETVFFRLFKINMKTTCTYDFEKNQFWKEGAEPIKLEEFQCGGPADADPGKDVFSKSSDLSKEIGKPTACSLDLGNTQDEHPSSDDDLDDLDDLDDDRSGGDSSDSASNAEKAHPHNLDMKITTEEKAARDLYTQESCENEASPEFWLDMCSTISTDTSDFINLKLNPEQNTGYNGRHIWEAMYSENCFSHGTKGKDERSSSFGSNGDLVASFSAANQNTNVDTESMCFEERVLYRLLSGIHAATSISIFWNYYPPTSSDPNAVGGKGFWRPNRRKYMKTFVNNPDRLRNLYFAFVVLLRSVKKARDFFWNYEYSTGDDREDEKISCMMHRLLGSDNMAFCESAFEAFDEKSMFLSPEVSKREFKRGFQNISSLMNCVKCSKCRLHGMVHILGIGAALKILLLPEEMLSTSISREEVVALFNTLHSLSKSISRADELLHQWILKNPQRATAVFGDELIGKAKARALFMRDDKVQIDAADGDDGGEDSPGSSLNEDTNDSPQHPDGMSDSAVAAMKAATVWDTLTDTEKISKRANDFVSTLRDAVIGVSFSSGGTTADNLHKPTVLQESYRELKELMAFDAAKTRNPALADANNGATLQTDVVVIGSGLAGMTSALTALERGASVVIVEKESRLGGNSGKASSGINGEEWSQKEKESWDDLLKFYKDYISKNKDEIQKNVTHAHMERSPAVKAFYDDTMKSGGGRSIPSRVELLVDRSDAALEWLRTQGVDLGLKAVLGGHQSPRTHRPSSGSFIGAESVFRLEDRLRKLYEKSGRVRILTEYACKELIRKTEKKGKSFDHSVHGIICEDAKEKDAKNRFKVRIEARQTVIATGGFGHDHRKNGLLYKHRPDLQGVPTTLGSWTTGDGLRMVKQFVPGSRYTDMQYVQVHPTGFVDPKKPDEQTKTLAAEVLRGVGGLLFNRKGERFCNELGTRQYVVDRMNEQNGIGKGRDGQKKSMKKTDDSNETWFYLLMGKESQDQAAKHVKHYVHKNLLEYVDFNDASKVSKHGIPKAVIEEMKKQMQKYHKNRNADEFGKTNFHNAPDISTESNFVIGKVTPVVHYTMGGVEVDDLHRVVSYDRPKKAFPGSSDEDDDDESEDSDGKDGDVAEDEFKRKASPPKIVKNLYAVGEVAGGLHGKNRLGGNSLLECVVFGRMVGQQVAILTNENKATQTKPFKSFEEILVADRKILSEADVAKSTLDILVGPVEKKIRDKASAVEKDGSKSGAKAPPKPLKVISPTELAKHNDKKNDCWVQLYEKIYDLTVYATLHPGGEQSITDLCGQDGTLAFESIHEKSMIKEGGFTPVGILASAAR